MYNYIFGPVPSLDDLTKILCIHVNEINKYLDVLEAEKKIESVELDRGVFIKLKI